MIPSQLVSLLRRTVPAGLPTLTTGSPGIGKSDIHRQVAGELDMDYRVIYPSVLDPVDIGGLPIPVGTGESRRVLRLLDDQLLSLVSTKRKTLLLIDELGQASPAMQAACAPLILDRTLGGRQLPDHVTICAATNRRGDRAGAGAILSHIISRMSCVVELTPDLESWSSWAAGAHVRPEIVSFIRFRPKFLSDFDPARAGDGKPYSCPRSLHFASRLLDAGLPSDIEPLALSGCLGEGPATELCAHLRLVRANIDLDQVLDHPSTWEMPKTVGERYALVEGIAYRTSPKNLDAVLTVGEKLIKNYGEYAVLLVRDALLACPTIGSDPRWIRAMSGPLGKLVVSV